MVMVSGGPLNLDKSLAIAVYFGILHEMNAGGHHTFTLPSRRFPTTFFAAAYHNEHATRDDHSRLAVVRARGLSRTLDVQCARSLLPSSAFGLLEVS